MLSSGFLLDTIYPQFLRAICMMGRLWKVEDPKSRASAGAGAFNLFRRAALERTPGMEWLRLEVLDDMALGQMLKRHGARSAVANGRDSVTVRFYFSLKDMARGMEKNSFSGVGNFSLARLIAACAVFFMLEMAPFFALLPWWGWGVRIAGVGASLVALVLSFEFGRWVARANIASLFIPVATVIQTALTLRAGWLAKRRGGMMWRGTLYPGDVLKRGRRLQFP